MKRKHPHVFIDQYGQRVYARTVKELRERSGGGTVSKMYNDRADGGIDHVGYVVGHRWFTEYAPVFREVK